MSMRNTSCVWRIEGLFVVRGGGGGEETVLGYEMYREPVFVRAIPILVC